MNLKRIVLGGVLTGLMACSDVIIKPVSDQYHLNDRKVFYALHQWSFKGRLVASDVKESWTTSIDWEHTETEDKLTLSGPLGQTGMVIIVTSEAVILDRGEGKTLHSTDIDAFIEAQLGLEIPVKSLRYWVLGLTHPEKKFITLADGFQQDDWIIQYSHMQQIKNQWMPRKIKAFQGKTRIKLMIDQWVLS